MSGSESPSPGVNAVDFRYAPPWWQTAICLPDDPDKAIVGKEGQLLFDFGGGGVRNFALCLQPELVGEQRWVRQQTLSARVPIVQTWKDAHGIEVLEEAFVAPPAARKSPAPLRLVRSNGQERLLRWAKPTRACSPVFTGAEVAYGGAAIQLQLAVPAGYNVTIVFGLCEGWHKTSGQRPLILKVEGSAAKTVDPVQDFGPNRPGLYKLEARDDDRNGTIEISVQTPEDAKDRNAILNALWAFEGQLPDDEKIITGEATGGAYAWFAGGALPEREAVLLVNLKNNSASEAICRPALRIQSVEPVRFVEGRKNQLACGESFVTASESIESSNNPNANNLQVVLPAVTLKPGASHQVAFTVDRHCRLPTTEWSVERARQLREAARTWWEQIELPFDTIQVPDVGIQGMLESCVRNIWQAREIKKGQPAFHVGPTVYRGLWVVDGSFLLEAAAMLGRGQDARAGVEYLLSHQKPDGSFDLLGHYWKENGIVLWAATRHAFLTQDKEWLRAHWTTLARVVKAIENMRIQASKDPSVLYYQLLPPGQIDGGISNETKPEYSNTYWSLAGLKAAIAAALWLGDEADATDWQKEYNDFYAVFRRAAARDTLKDKFGNAYVPTMMGNLDNHVPARGQWAFCHAVYPGQVFPKDDPFVESQLAMLRATKVQGMVFDTGWMKQGIWTYFASFYGHAQLWQGRGDEAAQVLYDFARHACPTRVWREEQKPVGKGGDEVGDMPHNWASAEFIRLTTHLLELDRGNELHLLEGLPPAWAAPGMLTRLNGVLTPFGPLHLELRVADDGRSFHIKVAQLKGQKPAKLVLHLTGLTGSTETLELPTLRDVDQQFAK